jgi:hypothetical protein
MIKSSVIDCAEACQTAAMECSITVSDLIGKEGSERCIELCLDCADISKLCSTLCSRDSRFMDDIMEVCVDICESCARECEDMDTKQSVRCADALWRCADECRRMLG